MSLKRECDRCHQQTSHNSVQATKYLQLQTCSVPELNASQFDLCNSCALSLRNWLVTPPSRVKAS